jgi:tripartite ATP-independent transporter DctM subunit
MEWWAVFILLLGGLVSLLFIGVPVAFAFLVVNIVGAFVFMGGLAGAQQIVFDTASALSSFTLAPIPLFLLMGEIMFRSGIAFKTVNVLDRILGRFPGRLAIIAIAASTLFSSFTGSTISNTALLGSTLLPEMRRKGYSKTMSIGPIIGSGGLAMMIPPSALAVLLGSTAHISVAGILVAGILPGLLMAGFYTLYITSRCILDPSLAPLYAIKRVGIPGILWEFLLYVCPLLSVILLVLGPIYAGIATPTEAAALGCAAAVILAGLYGRLTWTVVKESFRATVRTTSMIFVIIAGSVIYGQIIAFSGAGAGLIEAVSSLGLSKGMLILLMLSVLLLLGLFMDQVAMMMVTLPIFMPVVRQFGIDPIWFAVMMLIALDIGFTSPPFGLLLFIMKGIVPEDVAMSDIYKAALPFILCNILVVAIIFLYPKTALYLPALLQ